MTTEITLVDRIICAAALAWKDDGEVLATGIGVVPRLAASLCMKTINTDLMMTDSESWMVSEPVPLTNSCASSNIPREGWMGLPAFLTMFGQANATPWWAPHKSTNTAKPIFR